MTTAPTVENVLNAVEEATGVPRELILGKAKRAGVPRARHLALALLVEACGYYVTQAGRTLGISDTGANYGTQRGTEDPLFPALLGRFNRLPRKARTPRPQREVSEEDLWAESSVADYAKWDPRPWANEAACKGVDPDLFFPAVGGKHFRDGIKYCYQCPVTAECMEYALDPDRRWLVGIWGGLTTRDRRVLYQSGGRNSRGRIFQDLMRSHYAPEKIRKVLAKFTPLGLDDPNLTPPGWYDSTEARKEEGSG